MKKLLSLALSFVLLLISLSATAFANEISTHRYETVRTCTVTLTISSLGFASCSGTVLLSSDDMSIEGTMTLLQSSDQKHWSIYENWTSDTVTKRTLSMTNGCFVESGYYYKAIFTAKVYNSGAYVESATAQSLIKQW